MLKKIGWDGWQLDVVWSMRWAAIVSRHSFDGGMSVPEYRPIIPLQKETKRFYVIKILRDWSHSGLQFSIINIKPSRIYGKVKGQNT